MSERPWEAIKWNRAYASPRIGNDQSQVTKQRQMNRKSPMKNSFLRKDVAQTYIRMYTSSVLLFGTSNFKKTKEQKLFSFAHFSKVLAYTPYEIPLYVYIFCQWHQIVELQQKSLENYKIPWASWKKHCTGSK